MCGITGFINRKSKSKDSMESAIHAMTKSLKHRGPDASGTWVNEIDNIALGHARLSIIDLTNHAAQPMRTICARYTLVFNGEIYNYIDIRKELDKSFDIEWQSNSDTEVILNSIKHWGFEAAINKFVGMFAFALWDNKDKVLFLARDRLGIKPLYWSFFNNNLTFSSELKALHKYPGSSFDINHDAVSDYMRHNYIPGEKSIYKNINKLMPGKFLIYRQNTQPQIKSYWELKNIISSNERYTEDYDENSALRKTEDLIVDSIDKRMIADVSLGAFLSGGIDSSLVVALMQKHSEKRIKTFSIGFNEKEFNEAHYAKQVAKHLGTDHTEFYVSDADAMNVIPSLPKMYDEPFSDSSQIPTFLVSKLTREHVTVALSGDGGDELFAGYNRYLFAKSLSTKARMLTSGGRFLLKQGIRQASPETWDKLFNLLPKKYSFPQAGDKLHKLADVISYDKEDIYKSLVSHWSNTEELVPEASHHAGIFSNDYMHELTTNYVEAMQYTDMKTYLPDDILTKVDRASMAVSLEVRVPLLDHRLVEYVWKMPLSMKVRQGKSKWLLREILNKYVPTELTERPKMGFGIPVGYWLRGPLREWAESLLNEYKIKEYGLLNYKPIKVKWEEHLSGKRNWQYHLWDVLMLQAWCEEWL